MSDIIGIDEPIVKIACNNCKHLHRNMDEGFSCSAFTAIPTAILTGDNQHIKVLPGQKNDIVFEPIKE